MQYPKSEIQSINELQLLLSNLDRFHGQPIKGVVRPKTLTLDYDKMLNLQNKIENENVPLENLIVSDASDALAYVYIADKVNVVTEYEFGRKN